MSVMPSSTAYMAQALRNGDPDHEAFHKYFEFWIAEQNNLLQELISAAAGDDDAVLRPLVDRVIRHYEAYYQTKSNWAKRDVLSLFSPSWRSSLEDAFLWIGGWRPTMAFHLLYSKSGLQLEARLDEFLRGLTTADLADLSPDQLARIDDLQRKTVAEERDVAEKFAKQQEAVADKSMVELSSVVSEMLRGGEEAGEENERKLEATLEEKAEGLEDVLKMADDLRLTTLKEIVYEILTPIQAVHFLIAAAELHLRVHDWGTKRDAAAGGGGAGSHRHLNGFEQQHSHNHQMRY